MNQEYNKGRAARANALIDLHDSDEHARCVDVTEYEMNAFTAVVIKASTGATRTASSVRSAGFEQAKEGTIALPIADIDFYTGQSDPRQVVRNIA
ncbi:hypothetical protein MTO96_042235 [Rhipicephalus appendiculatus]